MFRKNVTGTLLGSIVTISYIVMCLNSTPAIADAVIGKILEYKQPDGSTV